MGRGDARSSDDECRPQTQPTENRSDRPPGVSSAPRRLTGGRSAKHGGDGGSHRHVGPFTLSTVGNRRMVDWRGTRRAGMATALTRGSSAESVPRQRSGRPPAFVPQKRPFGPIVERVTGPPGRIHGQSAPATLPGSEEHRAGKVSRRCPVHGCRRPIIPRVDGGRCPPRPCRSRPRRHSLPCRRSARCAS